MTKQEGMTVQTLIFGKDTFKTSAKAIEWAKEHDYKVDKIDETSSSFRFLQKELGLFQDDSFRTIEITEDTTAVVGRMKSAKAVWTTQYINRLPDSAFFYIASGGKKDEEGKTVPRGLRYFPYRDINGNIDIPHLKNAISRIPQSTAIGLTREKMNQLQERARKLLAEETSKSDAQEFPYVLTLEAVESDYMPKAGDSEIPWTLERVTPQENKFWKFEDQKKAKEIRDELVKSGWFTLSNTIIVDGLLQKVIRETYLYEPDDEFKKEVEKAKIISLFKTEKSDDEERYVLGVVLEPNDGADVPLNPDTQGDIYSRAEIRQACHLFMEKFQNMGHMHNKLVNKKVRLVECYIAPMTFKIKDPYGEERTIHEGTWLMGLHVVDKALWKKVKEDELTGLSMGGSARRLPEKVMSMEAFSEDDDDSDSDISQAA